MTNKTMVEIDTTFTALVTQISDIINEGRKKVVYAVNTTLVFTYFQIGKIIVEQEQKGNTRAEYGKGLLKSLSQKLTGTFGKGFSVENLDRMRFFYKTYAPSISSTPLTKSSANVDMFSLSWSHYLKLMRISNEAEHKFYEIESIKRRTKTTS